MKQIWRQVLVEGSSATPECGVVATRADRCAHPESSFAGSTTVILGAANSESMLQLTNTTATWSFSTKLDENDKLLRAYVIVACYRNWGGCHTATKGQRIEIELNGLPFERFRLAHIPAPHDDYFFRQNLPDIPRNGALANCQTIYAWPVLRERLNPSAAQSLRISIQNQVRWDIDYVGLLYEVQPEPEFDVALSFAGEDRKYVEQVASLLVQNNVKVFYDLYAQADLWGEDLYEHLIDVYKERARYALLFISQHYKRKLWANHERRAAQARAFSEGRGYILPARFDQTEIPGLLPTTGYIDLTKLQPSEVVDLLLKKLRSATGDA